MRRDQEQIEEQRSLEAAVSEGWPLPPLRLRVANSKPHKPYRTGSQTWHRQRVIKSAAIQRGSATGRI